MTRDEMIQLLVLSGEQCIGSRRGSRWLQTILEQGFIGYANMGDAELAAEIRAQGLDQPALSGDEDDIECRVVDDDADIGLLVRHWQQELRDQ